MKWYLPEDYAAEALRLIRGVHKLYAPDFPFAECGNILWKRVGRIVIERRALGDGLAA